MNALIRTALVGVALGVASASAFAITPQPPGGDPTRPYCGPYDTLVYMFSSRKNAIIKNRCGQRRIVGCRNYYVTPSGLDSGYRNSCMVRYKVEPPRL